MKKSSIILFGFVFLFSIKGFAQHPLKSAQERLHEYRLSKDKNENELIAIGSILFWCKRIANTAVWQEDKETIMQNHIEWLDSMFESGFRVDDPVPDCIRFNVMYGYRNEEEKAAWERRRMEYNKNCLLSRKFAIYERVMERFYAFYQKSFVQRGEGVKELEAIFGKYIQEKNIKNKDLILDAIQVSFKEQEKN